MVKRGAFRVKRLSKPEDCSPIQIIELLWLKSIISVVWHFELFLITTKKNLIQLDEWNIPVLNTFHLKQTKNHFILFYQHYIERLLLCRYKKNFGHFNKREKRFYFEWKEITPIYLVKSFKRQFEMLAIVSAWATVVSTNQYTVTTSISNLATWLFRDVKGTESKSWMDGKSNPCWEFATNPMKQHPIQAYVWRNDENVCR